MTGEGRPTAEQVLDDMVAAYRAADTYFDNAEYHERFVQRGDGVPRRSEPHQVSVAWQRPRRLRVTRQAPAPGGKGLRVTLACDGNRVRLRSSDHPAECIDRPAPEALQRGDILSLGEAAGTLLPVPLENLYPQLELLLSTDKSPPKLLLSADASLLPSDDLQGAACHRVRIDRPAGKYIAWIDQQTHLLRRLEMPTDEVRRQLDPKNALMRLDLWIDFKDATFNTPISVKAFQLEPGAGVALVESFQADQSPASKPAASDQ
ncbi:MAG: hypothetical protein AAGB00_04650 [Planctomycetota bacterium]